MIYVQVANNGLILSAGVSTTPVESLPPGLMVFPLDIPITQVLGYALNFQTGEFIKIGEKPSEFYTFDQSSFSWVLDQTAVDSAAAAAVEEQSLINITETMKGDAFIQQFATMTPLQVDNYIDTNLTNLLAPERNFLKKMARMLLLYARERYKMP